MDLYIYTSNSHEARYKMQPKGGGSCRPLVPQPRWEKFNGRKIPGGVQSFMVNSRIKIRKALILYDLLTYAIVCFFVFFVHKGNPFLHTTDEKLLQIALGAVCIFISRLGTGIYRRVWRYGEARSYLLLIMADFIAFIAYYIIGQICPIFTRMGFIYPFTVVSFTCLLSLSMRLLYVQIYKRAGFKTNRAKVYRFLLKHFAKVDVIDSDDPENAKRKQIRLAIIGTGREAVGLAEDLINSSRSPYHPVCFISDDKQKIGRVFLDIPVLDGTNITKQVLEAFGVQEIACAIPNAAIETKNAIIKSYSKMGYRLKVYDYPDIHSVSEGKRQIREFEIEDILFRKQVKFNDKDTLSYYAGKSVMVTGGGGSIGSEMCRQLAAMNIKNLIILDIAENGAYDIQQELKIKYGDKKDIYVEIVSVTDARGLDNVFAGYRPDIVIHAAAHKHVPLMEHNPAEAVLNNVFGTYNAVTLSEKYGVKRFLMVSTDKAVNPTNVMGATKRICEMIVQSRAQYSNVVYSATRFGNVLGSNGSVIPLFKRQIASGGPVTITDKRIIRYFMTIPEACQLVLKSGPMAKSGELFVLDMGEPVKILEMAETMIKLSGLEPYEDIDIVETGLRPGEKLYEELLIKGENTDKTDDERIFIERDKALTNEELDRKLYTLRLAVDTLDSEKIKEALRETVDTYKPSAAD